MKLNSLKVSAVVLTLCLGWSISGCKQESKADAATEQTAVTADGAGNTMASASADPSAAPVPVPEGPTTMGTSASGGGVPAAAVPAGPSTNIQFKETTFNYGKIKSGAKVTHSYKFTNTGKEPLVISNAQGSCGCTVPEWPKEPIAPGKSGEIKVTFDSTGKNGPQSKRVTLTANTSPAETFLTIEGEVEAAPTTPAAKN